MWNAKEKLKSRIKSAENNEKNGMIKISNGSDWRRLFLQEKSCAGCESTAGRLRRSAGDRRGAHESRTARDRPLLSRGYLLRDPWPSERFCRHFSYFSALVNIFDISLATSLGKVNCLSLRGLSHLLQISASRYNYSSIKLPRHSIPIKAIQSLLIETSASSATRERRLIKRSTPTDRRHSARDTFSERLAASAAAGSERRCQRSGVGHCGNPGAPSHIAGESRGCYQIAEVA